MFGTPERNGEAIMEANTNNGYSDEIEIDLGEVFMLMWHNLWLILLCAAIAAAGAFCVSKFAITPMYESTTKVYIIDKKDNNSALTYSDMQLASQLTKDYAQLIKSRSVLDQVINNLELEDTYGTLNNRVAVTTPTDSRILAITVTDPSPLQAQVIADEIRTVASDQITEVMNIDAVNTVDYADLPKVPASPSIKKWTALGFLVGAFLCVAVLLIRFLLDDTVKTSEDVERFLGMSTLAMIPLIDEQEAQKEKTRQEKIIQSGVDEGMLEQKPQEKAAVPEEAAPLLEEGGKVTAKGHGGKEAGRTKESRKQQ